MCIMRLFPTWCLFKKKLYEAGVIIDIPLYFIYIYREIFITKYMYLFFPII